MTLNEKLAVTIPTAVATAGLIITGSVFAINKGRTGSWNPKNWSNYSIARKLKKIIEDTDEFKKSTNNVSNPIKRNFEAFVDFFNNPRKGTFKCTCTQIGDGSKKFTFSYTLNVSEKIEEENVDENSVIYVGYEAVNKFIELYNETILKGDLPTLFNKASQPVPAETAKEAETGKTSATASAETDQQAKSATTVPKFPVVYPDINVQNLDFLPKYINYGAAGKCWTRCLLPFGDYLRTIQESNHPPILRLIQEDLQEWKLYICDNVESPRKQICIQSYGRGFPFYNMKGDLKFVIKYEADDKKKQSTFTLDEKLSNAQRYVFIFSFSGTEELQ